MSNFYSPIEQRLQSKARPRRNGCIEWLGVKSKSGYGQISLNYKCLLVHRVAWVLKNGEIPKHDSFHGICVLHKCDNPSCLNPDHLFLGTHQDNMNDRDNKGRAISGTTGKHHSEETKRKIGLANTGKVRSEETKRKISDGIRRKNDQSHRN